MAKKKEISLREKRQIDWSDWGRGLFTFPRLQDYTSSGLKRSERDEQCEQRGCKERGLIPNVNI